MLTELSHDQFALRRPAPADVEAICAAILESQEQLARWMPWAHEEYSRRKSRQRVEYVLRAWESGQEYAYLIVDPTDHRGILGSVGLSRVYQDQRRAELGYWVHTSHTCRGLATAAARHLARHAFETLELERIEFFVAVGNAASVRVAQKTGASEEGILRRRICHGDEVRDAHCFSLIRDDLP